jgi:hypothetical protein
VGRIFFNFTLRDQHIIEFCIFLCRASQIVFASRVRMRQVETSQFFIFGGSLFDSKNIPISFSGVSIFEANNFSSELFPTPGTSLKEQS